MSKSINRRSITFNSVRHAFNTMVTLAEQRDAILENSQYYQRNLRSLSANPNATTEMKGRILPSIQLAALREAGVSLRESQAMLAA